MQSEAKYKHIGVWSRGGFIVRVKQEQQATHAQKAQIPGRVSRKILKENLWRELQAVCVCVCVCVCLCVCVSVCVCERERQADRLSSD